MLSKLCGGIASRKGAYTRLLSQTQVLMRRLELHEEGRGEASVMAVQRPLAYSFDFIEIFAGSAKVTTYVSQLVVAVGPPIELSLSEEFNVSNEWVLRWLSHLICQRLRALPSSPHAPLSQ